MKRQSFELVSFEYPITRPLNGHWRYANYGLLLFGLVSFALFMTLNAYLVGYDVVSINKDDYNASESLPWLANWRSDYQCQKHTFKLGDLFRTNVSAFPYTVFNIINDSGMMSGFDYANNVLTTCDVIEQAIQVSPGDRSSTLSAVISCPPPLNFEASTTWTHSNHLMIGTVTANLFGDNTIPRALLDGLAHFGGEAYEGIYYGDYVTNDNAAQRIRNVLLQANPNCTSKDVDCPRPHVYPTFINAIGQTDLQIISNVRGETNINVDTLYNLLEVFYHAVRLDLGKWTKDNIYTNSSAFNSSLSDYAPSGLDSPAYDRDQSAERQAFRDIANSKGMLYANITPPAVDTSTPEAVIHTQYTCNTLRRKTAGTWIISVLSATLSMFLAAWGLAMSVSGWLARRHPGSNHCQGHEDGSSNSSGGLNSDSELLTAWESSLAPTKDMSYRDTAII